MAKFTDYTEKTEPVDTDLALIYDTPAKVNKKFTFGNLWKWIAKKIVSEGISQLDTTNQTIPGAINELNSNTQFMLQTSSKNKNNINIVINSRCSIILLLNNYSGYLAVYAIEIDSQYNCSQIEIINKKQIKPIITVDNKILTISENAWISALILSTIPITEIK